MSLRRVAKALAGFGIVVLVAVVGLTVWVVRHRASGKILSEAAGLTPGALLHAHKFQWTQMKGGERQWVLTARDASYSADKTSLTLSDASLSMTGSDGKRISLKAPTVKLKLAGSHVNRADLGGGLTIHYGNFVLTTEQATFTPDDDKLVAPGLVTIEGQGLKVTGVGLDSRPREQQFELENQVSTRITPTTDSAKSNPIL